jgi:hypothetical protein
MQNGGWIVRKDWRGNSATKSARAPNSAGPLDSFAAPDGGASGGHTARRGGAGGQPSTDSRKYCARRAYSSPMITWITARSLPIDCLVRQADRAEARTEVLAARPLAGD